VTSSGPGLVRQAKVLYRLPGWCIYISAMGTDAHANLEWDLTQRRPELRLLVSGRGRLAEPGGPPRPPEARRDHRVELA